MLICLHFNSLAIWDSIHTIHTNFDRSRYEGLKGLRSCHLVAEAFSLVANREALLDPAALRILRRRFRIWDRGRRRVLSCWAKIIAANAQNHQSLRQVDGPIFSP